MLPDLLEVDEDSFQGDALMMNTDKSEQTKIMRSSSMEFALNLKHWELKNIPHFTDSRLTQHLFLAFARAKKINGVLRMNEAFIDSGATEVAVRKRIQQFTADEWIKVYQNPTDHRTKLIEPSVKFEQLLLKYGKIAENYLHRALAQY